MKKDSFFIASEDWSRRKHLILKFYLKPAAPKLKTISRDGRVIILDGFAGRGRYENGDSGSPVHIAEVASECRSWTKPVEVCVFNIEKDPENFRILTETTKQFSDQGIVTNFNTAFSNYKNTITNHVSDCPMIVFIDPFKPSDLLFSHMTSILSRNHPTEILLVFHTPAVHRVICTLRDDAKTSPQQREKNSNILNEIFGNDSWKNLLASNEDEIDPEDVVTSYTECLLNIYASSRKTAFACTHKIEARYESQLKYHVILLTSHPDGVKLINDAFVSERMDIYKKSNDYNKKINEPSLNFEEFPDEMTDVIFRKKQLIEYLTDFLENHEKKVTIQPLPFVDIVR